MVKLKIEVEDYHIKTGTPRTGGLCPLAYAIGPRTGGHVEITEDGAVQIYNLIWKMFVVPKCHVAIPKQYPGDQLLAEFPLPPEAFRWMKGFDSGKKMEPFTFEFEVPEDFFKKEGK
jgi:hypothetical protein